MSQININSHDVLGKLSVVKNYLSVVITDETSLTPKHKQYLQHAAEANQELIDQVKAVSLQVKSPLA